LRNTLPALRSNDLFDAPGVDEVRGDVSCTGDGEFFELSTEGY
jgi:hypothetical protein